MQRGCLSERSELVCAGWALSGCRKRGTLGERHCQTSSHQPAAGRRRRRWLHGAEPPTLQGDRRRRAQRRRHLLEPAPRPTLCALALYLSRLSGIIGKKRAAFSVLMLRLAAALQLDSTANLWPCQ